MRKSVRLSLYATMILSAFTSIGYAQEQSFANQFLGNPLLILVVFLIIDLLAFAYRKIRK